MENQNIKAVYIIVNAGFGGDAVDLARENGARGATLINARGTAPQYEKSFLGIHIEPEKEMIICIVEESVADKIISEVAEKMGVGTSAHAVAFIMPIDQTTLTLKKDDLPPQE